MAEHKIPLPRKREYNKRTMNPGMTQFHNSIDWCDDLDIPSTTLHAIILFEVTGFTEVMDFNKVLQSQLTISQ